MESHLTGSTSSTVKCKPLHLLLFQRRKSILLHIFLPAEDHISILCSESIMLPNIQECRCPTSAPGRGVLKQIHFSGPAPPSSSFGQERRAEEWGPGKGKGGSLLRPVLYH